MLRAAAEPFTGESDSHLAAFFILEKITYVLGMKSRKHFIIFFIY